MPWPAQTPVPYLLDVNVLIALLDPRHVFHLAAQAWFLESRVAWATCAITQSGTIRILSHPRYGEQTVCTAVAAGLLVDLCAIAGHQFWPCDVNLVGSTGIDLARLGSSGQITDSYLLALAVAHGGRLASFDRRIVTDAVQGGREALYLIKV